MFLYFHQHAANFYSLMLFFPLVALALFLDLSHKNHEQTITIDTSPSGVRGKFSRGGFILWQMVVICIWCALFVTSQFDVIFMFSSEVC